MFHYSLSFFHLQFILTSFQSLWPSITSASSHVLSFYCTHKSYLQFQSIYIEPQTQIRNTVACCHHRHKNAQCSQSHQYWSSSLIHWQHSAILFSIVFILHLPWPSGDSNSSSWVTVFAYAFASSLHLFMEEVYLNKCISPLSQTGEIHPLLVAPTVRRETYTKL